MQMSRGMRVRNVNHALDKAVGMASLAHEAPFWRQKTSRGMETIEHAGVFLTEYTSPCERVLFSAARDANPFFHFFESLWILDGRDDVAFLSIFNSEMSRFSDDGRKFHAPYGYRLRSHFTSPLWDGHGHGDAVDQLMETICLLRAEPDTRRAVMCIWDPGLDLNQSSRDIPCNDMIFLKVNDGRLDMTVLCRSNDVILGAYGANAVQFSMLLEFIARSIEFPAGMLTQVSDSYHFYKDSPVWKRLKDADKGGILVCPYEMEQVEPYPLIDTDYTPWQDWLLQLRVFMNGGCVLTEAQNNFDRFFWEVAAPMWTAWFKYKDIKGVNDKNTRIDMAVTHLRQQCEAKDWQKAGIEWMERRRTKDEL